MVLLLRVTSASITHSAAFNCWRSLRSQVQCLGALAQVLSLRLDWAVSEHGDLKVVKFLSL